MESLFPPPAPATAAANRCLRYISLRVGAEAGAGAGAGAPCLPASNHEHESSHRASLRGFDTEDAGVLVCTLN